MASLLRCRSGDAMLVCCTPAPRATLG